MRKGEICNCYNWNIALIRNEPKEEKLQQTHQNHFYFGWRKEKNKNTFTNARYFEASGSLV